MKNFIQELSNIFNGEITISNLNNKDIVTVPLNYDINQSKRITLVLNNLFKQWLGDTVTINKIKAVLKMQKENKTYYILIENPPLNETLAEITTSQKEELEKLVQKTENIISSTSKNTNNASNKDEIKIETLEPSLLIKSPLKTKSIDNSSIIEQLPSTIKTFFQIIKPYIGKILSTSEENNNIMIECAFCAVNYNKTSEQLKLNWNNMANGDTILTKMYSFFSKNDCCENIDISPLSMIAPDTALTLKFKNNPVNFEIHLKNMSAEINYILLRMKELGKNLIGLNIENMLKNSENFCLEANIVSKNAIEYNNSSANNPLKNKTSPKNILTDNSNKANQQNKKHPIINKTSDTKNIDKTKVDNKENISSNNTGWLGGFFGGLLGGGKNQSTNPSLKPNHLKSITTKKTFVPNGLTGLRG